MTTSDVLCCRSCGQRLQIVCPTHGTDYVPDRRVNLVDDAPAPRAGRRKGDRPRMLESVSADPAAPSSLAQIAARSGAEYTSVTSAMSHGVAEGKIQRVGCGLYVRIVRPSPEPTP